MSEQNENAAEIVEIDCSVEQVKMQESEEIRVTITKTKTNELSIHVKTHEGKDVRMVSFFELVGILATAQADLLRQENQPQSAPMPMVAITLVEEDFVLDNQGQLAASGKKVGDILQIPAQVAELRDAAIENLKNTSGMPKMTVVKEDTDSSPATPVPATEE